MNHDDKRKNPQTPDKFQDPPPPFRVNVINVPSLGVFCEFGVKPGKYILLSPQEKDVHYSSWGQKCAHSAAHSSKRFKPLSNSILLCQGYCWIRKYTNKKHSCVMMFIMSSTSKSQFVFGFNSSIWGIFSFSNFEKF